MAEKKQAAKAPQTYYIATGRRKTAVARVRLTDGRGNIVINDRSVDQFFSEDKDRAAGLSPLELTDQLTRVDVFIKTNGGGNHRASRSHLPGTCTGVEDHVQPHERAETAHIQQHNCDQVLSGREESPERPRLPTIKPPTPAIPVPRAAMATPLIPGAAVTPESPSRPGRYRHWDD